MGTHTNKDFLFKMAKELKCGSKGCWIAAFVVCLVLGIVLAAIAVAMGGCEHAGKCIYETGSLGSSQSFDGCEKGDWDAVKCAASPNARTSIASLAASILASCGPCSSSALPCSSWLASSPAGSVRAVASERLVLPPLRSKGRPPLLRRSRPKRKCSALCSTFTYDVCPSLYRVHTVHQVLSHVARFVGLSTVLTAYF